MTTRRTLIAAATALAASAAFLPGPAGAPMVM